MTHRFHARPALLATALFGTALGVPLGPPLGATPRHTRIGAPQPGSGVPATADTAAKSKTALQSCVDSVTVLNRIIAPKIEELSQQQDTLGIEKALQPMREFAKSCESLPSAKTAAGADLGALGTVQLIAGDYAAGNATLARYIKDATIAPPQRSQTIETAQRWASATAAKVNRIEELKTFVDIADSLGFPRGRLNTRLLLAQYYRSSPATADKSFPLIRDVITIAKQDPDTANRAKRARAIGAVVKMAESWANQDGKPYDGQVIAEMANEVFKPYQAYMAMFDANALVGGHAEPIKGARWLNTSDTAARAFGDGKVYLLEFTAHWCGPCRASYPAIQALYEKYKAKGFEVIFATQTYGYFGETGDLAPDVELDSLKTYFSEHKVGYPIAVTGAFKGAGADEVQNNNFLNYSATGLPTVILVDRQGVIRNVWQGWGDGAEDLVEPELLKLLGGGGETQTPAGSSKGR